MPTVLVTGGTGFIATWVIVRALQNGHKVHTTIRSLARSDDVREAVHRGDIPTDQTHAIKFFQADLLSDEGWDEACAGCDYVMHVASPFPVKIPKDEDELIKPGKDGTLRVLRAAKRAGTVKRIVLTSSFAAVAGGQGPRTVDNPFTERDWTNAENLGRPVGSYEKSKTYAEKAAWQWQKEEGGGIELVAVNPVLVYGPMLGTSVNTSLELPRRLLNGKIPCVPDLWFGIVDVRDVAGLHILAMETPHAAGQRYLATSDEMSVSAMHMALYLKEGLPAHESRRVTLQILPNILVKLVALLSKTAKQVVPDLGVVKPASNAKARKELGWAPRSAKEAMLATAESLKKNGFLKD